MLQEFKDFIAKGNVMDLAVGIIIGAAFTAIVSSLVSDLINPIIGLVLGGADFTSLMLLCPVMCRLALALMPHAKQVQRSLLTARSSLPASTS
jgi:large conductance mechanosensitive channel protein